MFRGFVVGVMCLAFVGSAAASPALRVLKTSRSSGEFAVTALSASKDNAYALYVRGYGRGLSGFAVVGCSKGFSSIGSRSTQLNSMSSGRLYRLRLPFRGGDCDVTASLSGGGSIKLQVLG
jgi:hypothetical protein